MQHISPVQVIDQAFAEAGRTTLSDLSRKLDEILYGEYGAWRGSVTLSEAEAVDYKHRLVNELKQEDETG